MDPYSINPPNPPSAESSNNRKFVKDKGNDPDSFRKNREEKAIQLRKEKRADRTNIERRKFKIDSKENENTINTYNLRRLDILPKKAALLYDPDPKQQYESAVYFRRVLAADKNPPLDAILQIGTVIPALASFLTRFEHPKLQLEAAWSITNIACGEARHIQALLACQVVQLFASLIAQTSHANIKEQSLWALSNMSSEETACHLMCQQTQPHLLPLILHEIGVQCHCPDPIQQPEVFYGRQASESDNPSLSIMRHVTFICGNVIKQRPAISVSLYRVIFFAFADLLQSPDEEIKLDICQTVAISATQQSEVVAMVAEEGMISRLREIAILETSSSSLSAAAAASITSSSVSSSGINMTATRELALVALLSLFKSASPLLAKAMAASFQASGTPLLSLATTLLSHSTNNTSRRDAVQALVAWADLGVSFKGGLVAGGAGGGQLWSVLRELVLQGISYDVKMDIANLVCKLFPDAMNYLTMDVAQTLLEVCKEMISFSDGELLFRVLQSVAFLLKFSQSHHVTLQHLPALHEKVEFLAMHLTPAIAQEAQTVEKLILASLRQSGTDFDEYDI